MSFANLTNLVPECSLLKESQLAYLIHNDTPKAIQARQKILFFVIQHLESLKVKDIHHGKLMVEKRLSKLGIHLKIEQVLESRVRFVEVVEVLLSKLQQKGNEKMRMGSSSSLLQRPKPDLKDVAPKVNSRHEKPEPIENRYTSLLERVKELEKKVL